MMRRLSLFKKLFLMLMFFQVHSLSATHIIGGEIFYQCLGNDTYKITLKIYRDCIHGLAPFDNPAFIGVYDSSGVFIRKLNVPFPGSIVLPLVSIDPCLGPPEDVCVEQAIYEITASFPPIPGGYHLAYQRCCRNESILNIVNPLGTGATYYTTILDTSIVTCNSTPRYTQLPPIFICQNSPLLFDHSATDLDGDSLVYELCEPYLGATDSAPQPNPPTAPPYGFITWNPPFTGSDPLGGIPLSIDRKTGILTGTPNTIGQFVVGVCVSEYRNGVFLTTNKRDFQFNVTFCPPKPSASLPAIIISCGYTVKFENNSTGAFASFWDFGLIPATNDTSNLVEPSYTYPGVGNYDVTLITNRGTICSDTAFSLVKVYNVIDGANFSTQDVCVNTVASFTDLSVLTEGTPVAWDWIFQDGSTTDHLQNPLHTYQLPGMYNVFFTVYNENGCTDTLTKPIVIHPSPNINAGNDTLICTGITSSLSATGGISYTWNNSPYLSCFNCQQTVASPPTGSSTYFIVTGTDINGCSAKDSLLINVRPIIVPQVSLTGNGRCYNYPIPFYGSQQNHDYLCMGSVKWNWDFGDGQFSNEQNPVHLFTKEGSYIVSLSIQNSLLVKDTITVLSSDSCLKNIFVPNAFTPNGDGENDLVYLRTINATKINFRIYNRWGEEVFRTESLKEGWDGTYKGVKQTPQTFVYMAEVTFFDESEKTLKGNITLIE